MARSEANNCFIPTSTSRQLRMGVVQAVASDSERSGGTEEGAIVLHSPPATDYRQTINKGIDQNRRLWYRKHGIAYIDSERQCKLLFLSRETSKTLYQVTLIIQTRSRFVETTPCRLGALPTIGKLCGQVVADARKTRTKIEKSTIYHRKHKHLAGKGAQNSSLQTNNLQRQAYCRLAAQETGSFGKAESKRASSV